MAALVFAGFLVVLPFLILEAYDERNERSDRIDNAGIAHCTTIASCGFLLGVSLLLLGPYFGDRKKVSLLGADGINDWTCLHTPSRPLGGAEQGDRMPDARNVTRRRRKRVRLDARRKNAWMLAWIRVS